MRVVYLGNFRFPQCTENHIKSALESLGHEVVPIQEDEATMKRIMMACDGADLFLWTRTPDLVKVDGGEMLKAIKCPKASYHLDLYMGISRETSVKDDPFFYTDYMFSADGDPESLEKFKALGINAIWMPPAVNKDLCNAGDYTQEYAHDVVFIGSHQVYHKEWPYRLLLIDFLKRTYGEKLGLYPNPQTPVAHGKILTDIVTSSKVVVGDSLCMDYTHSNYWSNRIPETCGRGGFLIHPSIRGLSKHYTPGEHLATYRYGDFDQLKGLIDRYIEDEPARERVGKAGREHTLNNHTFDIRMKKVFEVMGLE